MNPKELEDLQTITPHILFTGSRVICNPPVLDTDEDVVICIEDFYNKRCFSHWRRDYEFEETSEEYPQKHSNFVTFRNPDNVNLIVVEYLDLFNKWMYATNFAKGLNLIYKLDRIELFTILFRDDEFKNDVLVDWLRKYTLNKTKVCYYG